MVESGFRSAVSTGIGRIQRDRFDYFLLSIVMILVGAGVLMIYSTSYIPAWKELGDKLYFLRRQLLFMGLGFSLCLVMAFLDYRLLSRYSGFILLGVVFLLILVLIPGVGTRVGGSSRWLRAFGFSFQPTELAKLVIVIVLADYLAKTEEHSDEKGRIMIPLGLAGGLAFLILLEPDFGSAVMIGILLLLLWIIAGVSLKYVLGLGLLALPVLVGLVVFGHGYRMRRVLVFLDPWSDPEGSGFQIIQSFVAFAHGGFFGQGLGEGSQKLFFLPEAHTDFIFSVIGEELGFLGVIALLLLYLVFTQRGIRIALKAPDLFASLLAFGIVIMVSFQALLNMGVVLGVLPTKGLTLPFISYGGTSLVINLIGVGILLSIGLHPHPSRK
ncbi:MAG: putative lipid II flippase FtsW [Proteobacteria bacterium]|nr:putative lipid II flippase FtsW [Pseudomonadota bacterium]